MSQPTSASGQSPIPPSPPSQPPLPVETQTSVTHQTAAKLPAPLKTDQAKTTLDIHKIKPMEKPGSYWGQTKDFVSQWWNFAMHTDQYLASDAKTQEVAAEIALLREKLNQSCGSPIITDFIHNQSVQRAPLVIDMIRDGLRGFGGQQLLESTLAMRGTLLQECLEANFLKMMDNLVQRVKDNAKAKGESLPDPINPNELINRIMALGTLAGGTEIAGMQQIQDIDKDPKLSDEQKEKLKTQAYEKMAQEIIQVALPHGSQDLVLPLPPGLAWIGHKVLNHYQYFLPVILRKLGETLKSADQEHVDLLAHMKQATSDGETVAKAIQPLVGKIGAIVKEQIKEKGEAIASPEEKKKEDWLAVKLKDNPLLRSIVGQFLKDCGDSPQMQLLFQKAETFLYPLVIHVLGNMVKHADKGAIPNEAEKSVLSLISHDVLNDLFEFAKQHPREDLGIAIKKYREQIAEINRVVDKEIKVVEEEFGDVSTTEMVARKVERDNLIAHFLKSKEKFLEEAKSPFDPLIVKFMQKMGLDEKGLTPILPFFQKEAAGKFKNFINDFCIDYYEEVIATQGKPPAAAARMEGYQEGRQLIQDIVKKTIPAVKTALASTEIEKVAETKRWYLDPIRKLIASENMDTLQTYAEPYIVDAVSDLFVYLADSNPAAKGQEKVDMASSALQNLAHIATERLKDADFLKKMDALAKMADAQAKMADGPEKEKEKIKVEKEKKKVFGPLAEEILQKAGWGDDANIRLPKLLKGPVKERLEGDILPDLLYRGMEHWLGTQAATSANTEILQSHTTDGDAVAKAMKVVADQTGAFISDVAKKVGTGIETPKARRKEAGIEYLLRDAIVKAIDKEPLLKSLNDPVMRESLIQILKGAEDVDAVKRLLKQGDKLAYPLFMHVLARVTEKAEGKQSTAATVVNSLLESIYSFAAGHRDELANDFTEHQAALDAVERKYPAIDTPALIEAKEKDLKEARKTFKAKFNPLVEDILQKGGLDPEGLSTILPFGSGPLSALIKSEALDFCVDFYEEIVATQGKAPKAAKGLPGYEEARRLFQAAMRDVGTDKGLMSAIIEALGKEDNRRDIQNALVDEINDRLFAGRLPVDKDWIMQPVKEIVDPSSPHLTNLENFVQPYLVDTVTDMMANLAVTYQPAQGESKGDMLESATAHLVAIMMSEIKDPDLAKKLSDWKALPEDTDEQKKTKSKVKDTLRRELFGPCSAQVLDKAGWNQPDNIFEVLHVPNCNEPDNIRIPKVLRPVVKRIVEKTVLPDQMFRIAVDMLVPPPFSAVDERRLEKMGGRQDLRLISEGIAEKLTPVILSKAKEYADLAAAKTNEKVAHNSLSIHDEALLGKDIDSILTEGKNAYKPAWNFTEGFLSRAMQYGLAKLALNYEGPNQGDITGNIALYLRNRLKEYPFKPALAETIRIYSEHTAPLRAMDKQITELRRLAVREQSQVGIKVDVAVQRSKTAQTALLIAKETAEIDRLLRDKSGNPRAIEKLMKRKQALPAKIAAQLEEQFKPLEKFHDRPLDIVLTEQKIARKQLEMELDQKFKIKETYQTLLKAFEPEITKILKDMGYPDSKSLPVPYFLKETLWKNLQTSILPDLCLTYSEKLIDGFDALLPDIKDVKKYEDKLTDRYVRNLPAGVKLPPGAKAPLVNGVYKLADYLVKEIESQVALKGREGALKALDEVIIPEMYGGEKGRKAVRQVIESKREEIAQWMGEESPEIVALLKDRMGKSLRQVIAAPLLKCTSNFIEHLEKLEQESPEKLFEFVFNAVPLVSDHIKTAADIAKKQGKTYIHEVDPLIMLRDFEKAGKLHPAMPGWKEMHALSEEETYVKQLEEQIKEMKRPGGNAAWYEHVDKLRGVKGAPEQIRNMLEKGPEYYLEEAKSNCDILKKQIDEKLKEHFYNDFSKYLMRMGGIKGPEDLPGGEEFWSLLGMTKSNGWEKIEEIVPMVMLEGMRAALSPQQLNSYMATLLKSLNENLTKRRQRGELLVEAAAKPDHTIETKVEQMEGRCQELIKQMQRMLPGTLISELRELPLIDQIPGRVLAESLRDALKQYPISKLVEEGMVAGLEKLPEKLPKTFEELEAGKKRRAEEDERNVKTIGKEAEMTVPNFIKKLETGTYEKWKRMQKKVDSWLEKTFGPGALKVKAFFDKIFHTVFITCIMGPLYKASRWLLSFGIEWYGRRVGHFAELARQSFVMPPDPDDKDQKPKFNINGNMLLRLADEFKQLYPAN